MKLWSKLRILTTLIVSLLIWLHIVWDYFHGGIPTHYLLHDDTLPGIPNWIGGIVLPFFTWFLLGRIQKRLYAKEIKESFATVIYRFLSALIIAIMISIFFTTGFDVIDYIMLTILVLGFVYPLYKSEYLLGWVLGSTFTFGAMIPMIFGSLLALILWFLYGLGRMVLRFLKPKKE